MPVEFKVLLTKVVKELSLEPLFLPDDYENIQISSMDINRPGLALTGYLDFFDKTRIIIFGKTEYSYLARFGSEQQRFTIFRCFAHLIQHHPFPLHLYHSSALSLLRELQDTEFWLRYTARAACL